MRTSEAVTPAKGIWWVFAFTMLLYIGLFTTAAVILRSLSRRWREGQEPEELPYSPPSPSPSEASP
jgi:cytochrome bd ubiquinol oxidase subunit I